MYPQRNINREPIKKWVCEKCHQRTAYLYLKNKKHICCECATEVVNKNG